jgi:RND family efflux transporter MFP subunit
MSRVSQISAYKITVFLAFVAVSAILAGCQVGNSAPTAAQERSALLVDVDAATPATEYTVEREFIGRVEPTRQSQVGFELAGELQQALVDEGDTVTSGEVLARLDTARLQARLAEVQAAVDQAVSASEFADRTHERRQEAAVSGGISEQAVDAALDAANSARAALAAAKARLNSVEVDLAKSNLTAPYDAVVIARNTDEGNIVAAGQAVLHLQESAAPEVRIGVSGELAATIARGDTYSLQIGANRIDATVRAVLPLRDPSTRTVDVILQLADTRAAYPGDLARMSVRQRVAEAGFWLPVTALAEGSRGLWTTNVVLPIKASDIASNGATHTIEQRSVEILYKQGSRVFVRGAIAAGDQYVTGGLQRIVPNQQVRVAGAFASSAIPVHSHE